MRRGGPLRSAPLLWSALLPLALACGGDVAPREVVLARVGSAARPARSDPPVAAEPRKLGLLTRNAVDGATPFVVEVPDGATRLGFSLACPTEGEQGCAARFRIESDAGDGRWQPYFRGEAQGAGWQDHEAALPGASGGPLRLRFSTELPRPEDGAALWGSLVLLGPGRRAGPDLILVSLDTLGADYLSAFSREPGVSPHLDAFLAESGSFRRTYAPYGNTLVSHASLFSGLDPRHHGVYPDGAPVLLSSSLVEALAAAGYRTAAFTEGAFVSAAFGFARGFDSYHDGALGLAAQMAGGAPETFERAAGWLRDHGRRERFFLFVHSYQVHSPYLPSAEDRALADRLTPGDRRVPSRDEQARRLLLHNAGQEQLSPRDLARLRALYLAEVRGLDAVVGRFLASLDASGLADDTLVVITADHGDQFGEDGKVGHGDSLHGRVLHVPLGFRWPGVIAPRSFDTPVRLVDVMPTVLALAGVAAPPGTDGTSLADALLGAAPPPEEPVFSEQRSARGECARLGLELGCRLDRYAVVEGRWKLETSDRPPWRRLYDLSRDPEEQHDVSDAHPEETRRLSELLAAYRRDAPAEGARQTPPAIDPDTRQRLHELGYAAPGEATPAPPPD